jgi:hypothetical protein
MMTKGFLSREIIAFMNRDNPSYWREGGVIMDELSHHGILGNDEIVAVFSDHLSYHCGHLKRVVDFAEVRRNRRGKKIPSSFQRGALRRIGDQLEIVTERLYRRDESFFFFAGKDGQRNEMSPG